jgi:hypothetical protein
VPDLTPQDLIDFDDDELYAELGNQLLGEGLSFGPEDFARFKRFAVKWLDQHLSEIKSAVCGQPTVVAMQSDKGGNALMEMATVADCIVALYGRPTATVAAVILVRRGLTKLCSD